MTVAVLTEEFLSVTDGAGIDVCSLTLLDELIVDDASQLAGKLTEDRTELISDQDEEHEGTSGVGRVVLAERGRPLPLEPFVFVDFFRGGTAGSNEGSDELLVLLGWIGDETGSKVAVDRRPQW